MCRRRRSSIHWLSRQRWIGETIPCLGAELAGRYPSFPQAFLRLFAEVTELSCRIAASTWLYGSEGCVEMDGAYGISKHIPGAITVGDNGGGKRLLSSLRARIPAFTASTAAISPRRSSSL